MLKRYLEKSGQFKLSIVDTTVVGQDTFRRLQPSPIGLQLLSQAMSASLLMTTNLKDAGTLSLKFTGEGKINHLTVEANTQGQVRGYAGDLSIHFEPNETLGLFEQALGAGHLTYRWRARQNPNVQTSVVELVPGEIATNITHFLHQSDQVRSAMSLGTKLDTKLGISGSGGILIQALPGANPNALGILEDRLITLPPIGGSLGNGTDGFETLESFLFDGFTVEKLHEMDVQYRCQCSKELIASVLASLPKEELQGDGEITVACNFCTKPYHFSKHEIDHIINAK